MLLKDALRLEPRAVVAFVGGGGKTTTLFRLAAELVAADRRVVITTTTRLFAAQMSTPVGKGPAVVLRYDGATDFVARVEAALQSTRALLLAGADVEGDKVAGIPPQVVDEIARLESVNAVLVEADGARARPFKAPAAHEPVVPPSTTLLVPVVGIEVLGTPLDEEHVHRPEVVATLVGAHPGDGVTPELVARVLAHPGGGLKNKPPAAHAVVLINQVETDVRQEAAHKLAGLLLASPAIDAVALGAVRAAQDPYRETRRRIAGIVLAAGAGTRMGDRVKQLLPWRGKTLIEHAVEIALASEVNAVIVVLGARADEVRSAIGALPVQTVINPEWEEGHSTSIRAGLAAVPPGFDAAIFINADQPYLTPEVANALIRRYAETGASIVAPLYAGKRGSPVLFSRTHFEELAHLQGEQGGREVLLKYPVEYVVFADAAPGIDVDTPEEYASILLRDRAGN